jgi:DNA-binding NarL/FixJ family response regulator
MRILIVEDQPLLQEVLNSVACEAFAEPSIQFAGSFAQAIATAGDDALDLVLLDLGLPDCAGIDTLKRFRKARPEPPVVVLSETDDGDCAVAAIEGGAAGYLMKTVTRPLISAALRLVAAGGIYIPREVMQRAVPPSARTLTERQLDVLRLIVKGLASKQIAERLRIAEDTVKQHARAAYAFLGVSSRTQAMSAATRRGIALD